MDLIRQLRRKVMGSRGLHSTQITIMVGTHDDDVVTSYVWGKWPESSAPQGPGIDGKKVRPEAE